MKKATSLQIALVIGAIIVLVGCAIFSTPRTDFRGSDEARALMYEEPAVEFETPNHQKAL